MLAGNKVCEDTVRSDIKSNCPSCGQEITECNINFNFKLLMCKNLECGFPLNSPDKLKNYIIQTDDPVLDDFPDVFRIPWESAEFAAYKKRELAASSGSSKAAKRKAIDTIIADRAIRKHEVEEEKETKRQLRREKKARKELEARLLKEERLREKAQKKAAIELAKEQEKRRKLAEKAAKKSSIAHQYALKAGQRVANSSPAYPFYPQQTVMPGLDINFPFPTHITTSTSSSLPQTTYLANNVPDRVLTTVAAPVSQPYIPSTISPNATTVNLPLIAVPQNTPPATFVPSSNVLTQPNIPSNLPFPSAIPSNPGINQNLQTLIAEQFKQVAQQQANLQKLLELSGIPVNPPKRKYTKRNPSEARKSSKKKPDAVTTPITSPPLLPMEWANPNPSGFIPSSGGLMSNVSGGPIEEMGVEGIMDLFND